MIQRLPPLLFLSVHHQISGPGPISPNLSRGGAHAVLKRRRGGAMASTRPTCNSYLQPSFLMVLREEGIKWTQFEGFLPKRVMRAVLPTKRAAPRKWQRSGEKLKALQASIEYDEATYMCGGIPHGPSTTCRGWRIAYGQIDAGSGDLFSPHPHPCAKGTKLHTASAGWGVVILVLYSVVAESGQRGSRSGGRSLFRSSWWLRLSFCGLRLKIPHAGPMCRTISACTDSVEFGRGDMQQW
jgi:hypothetical protein